MGVERPPKVSLVVPTFGRVRKIARLLKSLEDQTLQDFELIIADQNPAGFLDGMLAANKTSFPMHHINRPEERGISRARNLGLTLARGDIIVFPDDDAWYPPDFLARGVQQIEGRAVDIVTGRSVDTEGRTINGRFAKSSQMITRSSVWVMQVEWMTFYRRQILDQVGGFDEHVGIGSDTPWQAAEGPDLLLRALSDGARCFYDVDLVGYHEEYETHPPSAMMTAKAHAYARGMGYVLRKNSAGLFTALYWSARPLFQMAVSLLKSEPERARHFLLVSLGRLEGWLQRPGLVRPPVDFSGRDAPGSENGGLVGALLHEHDGNSQEEDAKVR